jgi:hypothetical protein
MQTRKKQPNLEFTFWKALGDELIFTCPVASESQVYHAIDVWLAAIRKYVEESLDDNGLGAKGGAFLGTFPGPDTEVAIPRVPAAEISGRDVIELNDEFRADAIDPARFVYDYIGPSIDTGFRVLTKSTARFFALSIEVAYVLASRCKWADKDEYALPDMHLLHSEGLRGVWDDRRYPVFALDTECENGVNSAFKPFGPPVPNIDEIVALCKACFESDDWPFHIYLPKSGREKWTKPPENQLEKYLERIKYEQQGEERPSLGEAGGRGADDLELPPDPAR